MNFLAHCFLADQAKSDKTSALVAGGFIGDFIKGPIPNHYPKYLQLGVQLHRRIDAFSNTLPSITQSSAKFPKDLRRIAPPMIDIIADYFLANHWSRFSEESLRGFSSRTYLNLSEHENYFPSNAKRFLLHAQEIDLLSGYLDLKNVEIGLSSITKRLKRPDLDNKIRIALPNLIEQLETDFHIFFPHILEHSNEWAKQQLDNLLVS